MEGSDEEVYFGKFTESEIPKIRHFQGDNYDSPMTPRLPRFNLASSGTQRSLPDVLGTANTSTPHERRLPDGIRGDQSTPKQSGDCSLDESDDIIILDDSRYSNSVITLSDDESFAGIEVTSSEISARDEAEHVSLIKEPVSTIQFSDENESVKVSKEHCGGLIPDGSFGTDSVFTEDKSHSESDINKSESTVSVLIHNSLINNSSTNNHHLTADKHQSVSNIESINKSVFTESKSHSEHGINKLENTVPFSIQNSSINIVDTNNIHLTADKCESVSNLESINDSVLNKDMSYSEGGTNTSENTASVPIQISSINTFETNNLQLTADKCVRKSNVESSFTSLVQDINEFVGDSNVLEKDNITFDKSNVQCSIATPSDSKSLSSYQARSKDEDLEMSSFVAMACTSSEKVSELRENANITEELLHSNVGKQGKESFNLTNLSHFDFSLNGVTDSILNISHGSSLPSPCSHQSVSPVLQKPDFYEEHLNSTTDISDYNNSLEDVDLHMSVDEVDFQQQGFSASCSIGNTSNISQPSEYKSCPSAYSSYSTAYDKTGGNNSTSEQSDSFKNYRDTSTELDLSFVTDTLSIKSDEEHLNRASFEMVMQNRQNSFNGTPALKMPENIKGDGTRIKSKLPVFQNTKSLLRSPKLFVKPETLKISSYKFATHMSKLGNEKTSTLPKPESNKLHRFSPVKKHENLPSVKEKKALLEKEKTFTKTSAKVGTPKQLPTQIKSSSTTKSKIPTHGSLSVYKTPSQNNLGNITAKSAMKKTPVQNISSIPRAVKSDSKVNRVLTTLSYASSSEKSAGKGILMTNKYKNVVSPIQAYIRGSTPVFQRKAHVTDEVQGSSGEQPSDHTIKIENTVPKVIQKLNFENVQGQENINPNLIDMLRDTIPSKVLEPSLQVFWKENEQPQLGLPKMGEKLTKILVSPAKVKLTRHEGRVHQTPVSKGVLLPNKENMASTSTGALPADNLQLQSDARISVRIQKNIDLP